MKSSSKFDLREGDQLPVIKVKVSKDQEDLRDKVAQQIFEKLGHESVLATVFCVASSDAEGFESWEQYEIVPISTQQFDARKVTSYMSETQLRYLKKSINLELQMREKGIVKASYNYGNSAHKFDALRNDWYEKADKE